VRAALPLPGDGISANKLTTPTPALIEEESSKELEPCPARPPARREFAASEAASRRCRQRRRWHPRSGRADAPAMAAGQ
jgi:hypothetical protein